MTVGVVLAGGLGTRLGRRKACLRLPANAGSGRAATLTEWALDRLAAVREVDELVVAAGRRGPGEVPPLASRAAVTIVPDGPGDGPAAGVLGAARSRPERRLLVLACDLPLAPVDLLAALGRSRAELAAATADPDDPRSLNPTCALWTPPALDRLAARVQGGDNRLYPLTRCADLRVEAIDAGAFGDPDDVLLNVNAARNWERAQALLRRRFAIRGSE